VRYPGFLNGEIGRDLWEEPQLPEAIRGLGAFPFLPATYGGKGL